MATKCRIAMKQDDGTYVGRLVHYDGYPENMTKVLKHFNTEDGVKHLMSTNWKWLHVSFGDWRLEGDGWNKKWTRDRLDELLETVPCEKGDNIYDWDNLEEEHYIFETLRALKKCRSLAFGKIGTYELSVAYTYVWQDGKWYGYYEYAGDDIIPIDDFVAYVEASIDEQNK